MQNWFKRGLKNPTTLPHKINVQWPLSVAVDALLAAHRRGGLPAQEPTIRLFILSRPELEFLSRAVDQALD